MVLHREMCGLRSMLQKLSLTCTSVKVFWQRTQGHNPCQLCALTHIFLCEIFISQWFLRCVPTCLRRVTRSGGFLGSDRKSAVPTTSGFLHCCVCFVSFYQERKCCHGFWSSTSQKRHSNPRTNRNMLETSYPCFCAHSIHLVTQNAEKKELGSIGSVQTKSGNNQSTIIPTNGPGYLKATPRAFVPFKNTIFLLSIGSNLVWLERSCHVWQVPWAC